MSAMSKTVLIAALACASLHGAASIAQESSTSAVDPNLGARLFSGTYSVTFRGIRAGTLDFNLRKHSDGYVYESIAHPRGLARIVVNDKVREATEFDVVEGVIVPRYYELDDGSARDNDDTRLRFDWEANKAHGTHEGSPLEIPLAPAVQDRMSAQVVVMQLLHAGKPMNTISFIDRDALKEYSYKRVREESIETAIGELATVVIESSRARSNRVSRIWYAPSLGFVPVRGEQERKGKVETVFEIVKLVQ